MSEVSQDLSAKARKIETLLRNSLADIGQARVADKMGVSDSTVSRMKDSDIERMALFLASMDLRVISGDMRAITATELSILKHCAARGLPHIGS